MIFKAICFLISIESKRLPNEAVITVMHILRHPGRLSALGGDCGMIVETTSAWLCVKFNGRQRVERFSTPVK